MTVRAYEGLDIAIHTVLLHPKRIPTLSLTLTLTLIGGTTPPEEDPEDAPSCKMDQGSCCYPNPNPNPYPDWIKVYVVTPSQGLQRNIWERLKVRVRVRVRVRHRNIWERLNETLGMTT